MTAELTAEEIVTHLLSSHEILKQESKNSYVTASGSLGEYLKNIPPEDIIEETTAKNTKYTFIKEGMWKF